MKPISYYTTYPTYPVKTDFTTIYAYQQGKVLWKGPASDWPAVKGSLSNYILESVVDEDALKAARAAYNAESNRLTAEFKRDLFVEHGVTDHPKAERCYSLAWEHGHSAGLCEVANYFDDFVDLIKD